MGNDRLCRSRPQCRRLCGHGSGNGWSRQLPRCPAHSVDRICDAALGRDLA